jgi:hypothetical protein
MKVKDLIDRLNRDFNNPDEEILVAYWDKFTVQQYAGVTLSNNQWTDIVAEQEAHDPIQFEQYGEVLQEIADEVGTKYEEEEED